MREGEHFLNESVLNALRNGPDKQKAFAQICQGCFNWARRIGNLPEDTYREIVSESLVDELDALRLPDLNAAEVWKRLRRALGRHRTRAIRERQRMTELKDFNPDLVSVNDVEEKIEAAHMLEVARVLRGFISLSLDSLNDRDYTLLYDKYQLNRYGIKPRAQRTSLEATSPGARKTALSRARIRLLNELERRLSEAATCLDEDSVVVRDALRAIRSGNVLRNNRK